MPETASRAQQGIDRAIGHYFAGLRDGSVATLKEAFRPQALVSGYIGTERFVKPVQYLYQYVKANPSPAKRGDRFTCRVIRRALAGRTASVTLRERNYLGFDYITNLQLMKFDQRWWIVSKLFSGTPST
jgi:hypothetical protein